MSLEWKVHNPNGKTRILSTKPMPGTKWLDILVKNDCRVEICQSSAVLTIDQIKAAIGKRCDGVIGQLTEKWGDELFQALKAAGGKAYSNMAVGFDNVDVAAATRAGITMGNTPGVLTETTAEMAVSLIFAAARRLVEADKFMRNGMYKGWLPDLFVGHRLDRMTLGVIGAGRIGAAAAKMMVGACKMNIVYYDVFQNKALEEYVQGFSDFLVSKGEKGVTIKRASSMEEVLKAADVVTLHTVLDKSTRGLINEERLKLMKSDAILVNTSRGPVIDENALVRHCRANPRFYAALDVFEKEPAMANGLKDLDNVIVEPHIASATLWTRGGMATLAACNVLGSLRGYPLWNSADITAFVDGDETPKAMPSIVNAKDLGLKAKL